MVGFRPIRECRVVAYTSMVDTTAARGIARCTNHPEYLSVLAYISRPVERLSYLGYIYLLGYSVVLPKFLGSLGR